jgi:hypothetical protein
VNRLVDGVTSVTDLGEAQSFRTRIPDLDDIIKTAQAMEVIDRGGRPARGRRQAGRRPHAPIT